MSALPAVIPLLVFEAAGCLMAVPASEVGHLQGAASGPQSAARTVDLDEYFSRASSQGPWLEWARGAGHVWLRVRRIIDVVPVAVKALTPMPGLLRHRPATRAFVAAGVRGEDVFLLLDPGKL